MSYWRELQTAISEPLFKEFLEWKRKRQVEKSKQSRHTHVKAIKSISRKAQRTK